MKLTNVSHKSIWIYNNCKNKLQCDTYGIYGFKNMKTTNI